LAWMKANIFSCSQLVCWGFFTCTFSMDSKFRFIILFLPFYFFLCGLLMSSLGVDYGCLVEKNPRCYEYVFSKLIVELLTLNFDSI
jgi:hypothetical protein